MKETVYEHASGNSTFTVTAAERWSIGMINKLAKKYPNEVTITATNPDGSMVAHIPFEWMRIVPKKKVELSEERRTELAERMKAVRGRAVQAENDAETDD